MDPDVTSPEGRPTPASLTRHVLLFCGKRKSGKDFVTDKLMEMIPGNEKGVIIRLSGPLKKCYAKDNGLEYKKLLEATEYKEKHRKDMIKWSEEIRLGVQGNGVNGLLKRSIFRNRDYGYFCRAALEMYEADRFSILIVSDCRRKTDFRFFEEKYPGKCLRIRVRAPEEVR